MARASSIGTFSPRVTSQTRRHRQRGFCDDLSGQGESLVEQLLMPYHEVEQAIGLRRSGRNPSSAVSIMYSAPLPARRGGQPLGAAEGRREAEVDSALQKSARSLAMASGAASVISHPAPWASPFTATINGLGKFSIRRVNRCPRRANSRSAASGPFPTLGANAWMSAPAQNARSPAPDRSSSV